MTRMQRAWVGVLLGLLVVPGVIGFDVWPLTGWRLFSASRDGGQTVWVLAAIDGDGQRHDVDFDDLPMKYSTTAWPLDAARRNSPQLRAITCALVGAARQVHPGLRSLALFREKQVLERDGDDWQTAVSRTFVTECRA